ncbi:FkbM family methyltransferase [Haloprofundus halophilus]|uniref:FkbM family methyltransferase n=1 Tax=Haloprofundus halophilus TaxID=2283527 RepID=UPI000E440899|nr:FkbM family methyltransferase [Haloprofundus halophilus]
MLTDSPVESVHKKVKSLYRGPVRSAAIKTGLHDFARHAYGEVITLFVSDIQTHKIAGITAKYKISNYSDWERQRSFTGEIPVMKQFVKEITAGDTVWDVGANMGSYTCLAGRAQDDVSVVAFEPAPKNRVRLRNNIELNNITATIRQEALDETIGQMGLFSENDSDGQYSLTESQEGLQVPTTDADNLVNRGIVPQPDHVKIDVEGAELRVLRGMETTLKEVKCLYLEVHPSKVSEYGGSVDEIKTHIAAAGLEYEKIHERGEEFFLRAVRR